MNKQGYILVGSVFLMVFLAVLLGAGLMRINIHMRLAETQQASQYAFYAAETGIEDALRQLRQGATPNIGNFLNGATGTTNFIVNITNTVVNALAGITDVTLQSTGNSPILSGAGIQRIIQTTVRVENPARFFTSSLGNIIVPAGANITGNLMGNNLTFNTATGNPRVAGDVLYTGSITVNTTGGTLTDNAAINYVRNNIASGNVSLIPAITFINLDTNRYDALSQSGAGANLINPPPFSGNLNPATLKAPNGLVYVNGDVRIEGMVTGSMLIVATGDIRITGDITYQGSDTNGDGQIDIFPQLGLFAGKDIIIDSLAPQSIEINAFIFANRGVFRAESSSDKTPKGTLTFKGAIAVRGDPAGGNAINLATVYQGVRTFTYDNTLSSNRQIPFMTFFANIIDWQEI